MSELLFPPSMLVNHLWQSTLFVVAIWCLTLLLRRNSARLRYWLWLAASLKFLVPFALLAALGAQLPWHPDVVLAGAVAPQTLDAVGTFAAPMAGDLPFPVLRMQPATVPDGALLILLVFFIWATGAAIVFARWVARWLEIRRALRNSEPVSGADFPAPVRSTRLRLEPGVVGIIRPSLLLPAGIDARLTPEQMQAVLAHERCHLRWRDNLTASLHMLVETLLWYYPLVWWIGARLIAERERDCDEQVLREGHAPESYAEGILAVCEHYIASRLPCVAGVSGADLRQRIERIVKKTLAVKLDGPKKLVLASVLCCTVAAPIAAGMVAGSPWGMLLSLNRSSTATVEYMQLHTAMLRNLNTGISARGPFISTCPAPSPEVIRKQRAFATSVAKLSATEGEKSLLYAVAANSTTDVQRLLAEDAPRNGDGFLLENSLMHIAARFGDPRMLETLANAGLSIDGFSSGGLVAGMHTPLMVAISAGRRDNARWFIQRGADVNAVGRADWSALLLAVVSCGDQDLVRQLIQAGALPNAKTLRVAENTGFDVRTDVAAPPPALQGWQLPSRDGDEADIDGDGVKDRVGLYASADRERDGVFVKLSSRDPDRWIQAAEARLSSPSGPRMRISVARPGSYRTACAKGSGPRCATGEATELTLRQSGIDFFMEEGARSIVYWDDTAQGFKQVWTSD